MNKYLILACLACIAAPVAARAQASAAPVPTEQVGLGDYFSNWEARVNAVQAEQPGWVAPLITVTPLLIQQVRYDTLFETTTTGAGITNIGAGKGLELIPDSTNEVQFGAPPYIERTGPGKKPPISGFNDWPFLLVKQRLASGNAENGNYVVTAYLGLQADSGIKALTSNAWILTPTLGIGKGWGDFDVQATVSLPIPLSLESTIGTQVVTNTAFQYRIARYFWPELEFNWTYYIDGVRGGKNQLFVTPGIVLGKFKIHDRVGVTFGVGYQEALAPMAKAKPLTPAYDHAWIVSGRLVF